MKALLTDALFALLMLGLASFSISGIVRYIYYIRFDNKIKRDGYVIVPKRYVNTFMAHSKYDIILDNEFEDGTILFVLNE